MRILRIVVLIACGAASLQAQSANSVPSPKLAAWKAGVAAVDITPDGPAWMAGYAFRKKPSESVAQKVQAKALALEDAAGTRVVMVTLDLIGVPRQVREAVERMAAERFGLGPEAILLNASHTHSGASPSAFGVSDPAYVAKAEAYGRSVGDKILEAIGAALAHTVPADLAYTRARAGFAMNRRLRMGDEIRNTPNPDGPVDHDVPVLRVKSADGKLMAVVFGYACHNTVTNFQAINGDYAGHAQAFVEEAHPGAIALFMMGAGGDQNPYPRHASMDQAAQHGRTLANAVETALQVVTARPLTGPLRSAYGFAELSYSGLTRADLERRARSKTAAEKARAEELLKKLAAGETLPASYPCPVQVIQLGSELTLVAIGGEITVEYSLRLKRELAGGKAAVWVAGYSNEVFGYLGSRQVILEGGYEGYSANLGRHPAGWAATAEDRVIEKVYDLIRATNHYP